MKITLSYRNMRRPALAFFLAFALVAIVLFVPSADDGSDNRRPHEHRDTMFLDLGIWHKDGLHPLMVRWVPTTDGSSAKLVFTLQPYRYSRNLLWIPHLHELPAFTLLNLDSAPAHASDTNKRKRQVNIFTSFAVLIVVISLGCFFYKKLRATVKGIKSSPVDRAVDVQVHFQFTRFNFDTVVAATNRFSDENKIGEGGFGAVYKGLLSNGVEIAVKRMSLNCGQGAEEFSNEVISLAKLQHRNLVKLLGFCSHKRERMLIYQYMPNRSLDYHLFDPSRRKLLTWKTRSNIINGIARALLYLHEDSIPTIIHRDVKASNVLLDDEMNPQISDFGLARIIGNQSEMMTERIIGTEGYIAPEYINHGTYSEKSDVFSFGVLTLEIISGRRSRDNNSTNLIQQAWELYAEGKVMQLVDPDMERDASFSGVKIKRCIQVSLLCIQQNAAERPKMSAVVCLLSDETTFIRQPNLPLGTRTSSKWVALCLWLRSLLRR